MKLPPGEVLRFATSLKYFVVFSELSLEVGWSDDQTSRVHPVMHQSPGFE